MARIGPLRTESTATWKYALVGGVVSLPATTASYWQTGSEMSLASVLLGSLLAGYLAKRKTGTSAGVGVRAGLVGALPVLWVLSDVLGASTALSGPPWFVAAGTLLTILTLTAVGVLGFGLSALVGGVGGRVGGWLAGSNGSRGSPPPVAE